MRLVRLKPLGPGRTARYNENLQSRTTLGPEISRKKICGLLKCLPQRGPGPEGPTVAFMHQGPRDHDPALIGIVCSEQIPMQRGNFWGRSCPGMPDDTMP